jgi:integrase
MKRQLPAHVYAKRGGLYFQRRGWDTVRIQSAPHTPEFAAEYALILRGTPPAPKGKTFAALVLSYKSSAKWKALAPRTKADYDKVLAWVLKRLGPLPADRMQRKDVIRARDENASTTRFATYIVQVLRVLMTHAMDIGWRKDNPAEGVGGVKSTRPPREPWPVEKIAAFREACPVGNRARLIFEMCLGTGQRIGDVLKMRWSDIDGDGVKVRQGKTGAVLWVPLTGSLRAVLDATPRLGLTICAWGRQGRPTSYRGAADLLMAVRVKIGAEAWDIHGLRHSAASELAALGCSDDLIQAVTGHRSKAMVALYAGAARQKSRAKEAQGKRE